MYRQNEYTQNLLDIIGTYCEDGNAEAAKQRVMDLEKNHGKSICRHAKGRLFAHRRRRDLDTLLNFNDEAVKFIMNKNR